MPIFNVLNSKYLKALLYMWLNLDLEKKKKPKQEESNLSDFIIIPTVQDVCTWWRQNKSHLLKRVFIISSRVSAPRWRWPVCCSLLWLSSYSWRNYSVRFQHWDCHYAITRSQCFSGCSPSPPCWRPRCCWCCLGLWREATPKRKQDAEDGD